MQLTVKAIPTSGDNETQLNLKYDEWCGQRVADLPYLDALLELCQGVLRAGSLVLGLRVKDQTKVLGEMPLATPIEAFRGFRSMLLGITALRDLCVHFDCQITWEHWDAVEPQEPFEWFAAAQFIRGKQLKMTPDAFVIDNSDDALRAKLEQNGEEDISFFKRQTRTLKAWGRPFFSIPVLLRGSGYSYAIDGDKVTLSAGPTAKAFEVLDPDPDSDVPVWPTKPK